MPSFILPSLCLNFFVLCWPAQDVVTPPFKTADTGEFARAEGLYRWGRGRGRGGTPNRTKQKHGLNGCLTQLMINTNTIDFGKDLIMVYGYYGLW